MILQYTAAALSTENKFLSHPASMGVTAALKLRDVLDNVERILAIELMSAAQGVDFHRQEIGSDKALGQGTRGVYALIREHIPFIESDTTMYGQIETMRQLVADEEVVERAT